MKSYAMVYAPVIEAVGGTQNIPKQSISSDPSAMDRWTR